MLAGFTLAQVSKVGHDRLRQPLPLLSTSSNRFLGLRPTFFENSLKTRAGGGVDEDITKKMLSAHGFTSSHTYITSPSKNFNLVNFFPFPNL